MNLSRTASYSMSVLSYMALHDDIRMSAADLHRKLSIPYSYLRHVLKMLSERGFITGARGRSGGFVFRKSTGEISLADIIDSTDGLERMNSCILGFGKCPFDNECVMHSVWTATMENRVGILRNTTLADVVRKKKPGEA